MVTGQNCTRRQIFTKGQFSTKVLKHKKKFSNIKNKLQGIIIKKKATDRG